MAQHCQKEVLVLPATCSEFKAVPIVWCLAKIQKSWGWISDPLFPIVYHHISVKTYLFLLFFFLTNEYKGNAIEFEC